MNLFANVESAVTETHLERFLWSCGGSLVFGLIGIFLILLAFKMFDWMLPKVEFQKELSENKSIPWAIVIAALILGVAYIVGQVVR